VEFLFLKWRFPVEVIERLMAVAVMLLCSMSAASCTTTGNSSADSDALSSDADESRNDADIGYVDDEGDDKPTGTADESFVPPPETMPQDVADAPEPETVQQSMTYTEYEVDVPAKAAQKPAKGGKPAKAGTPKKKK
jgi:hypothetical protein